VGRAPVGPRNQASRVAASRNARVHHRHHGGITTGSTPRKHAGCTGVQGRSARRASSRMGRHSGSRGTVGRPRVHQRHRRGTPLHTGGTPGGAGAYREARLVQDGEEQEEGVHGGGQDTLPSCARAEDMPRISTQLPNSASSNQGPTPHRPRRLVCYHLRQHRTRHGSQLSFPPQLPAIKGLTPAQTTPVVSYHLHQHRTQP